MATISVGPNGSYVNGDNDCPQRDFLVGQSGPFGSLVDLLIDQRLIGTTELRYDPLMLEVDRHMPMRANTATNGNILNTNHYRTDVGYDGLLNQKLSRSIVPQIGQYDNRQKYLDACGLSQFVNLGSSGNLNNEACNPGLGGPMPTIGREKYGREAFVTRLVVPPMCLTNWVNKEAFTEHWGAILRGVKNGVITQFNVDQHRWMVAHSRYNAVPLTTPLGDGRVRLVDDPNIFQSGTFGYVPQHWGSPEWFASMLQYSEVPAMGTVTVMLPAAILQEYKKQLIGQNGFNLYTETMNLTKQVNDYIVNILNDSLVYQHPNTGRKIIFKASENPIYLEVKDLGPGVASWEYQEPWVMRPSEQNGQIMRRSNPNWGRQCACAGDVLCAMVTVSIDDGPKPFYKEPLPDNNPAGAALKSLFASVAGGRGVDLNTSLNQIYPSSEKTTIFTGDQVDLYLLKDFNERARAAGSNCDVANNMLRTWIGGFTEIAAQYVENAPREIAIFMLRMPTLNMCAAAPIVCDGPPTAPAPGDLDPAINDLYTQPVPVPDPVPPTPPAVGTVFQVGSITTVTAPCTGTKTVKFTLVRKGGTFGALTVNLAATPTAHGGTVPSTANFANGQDVAIVTWTIPAWNNTDPDAANETYVITLSGTALDAGSYTTRTVCIKPVKVCPGACDGDANDCGTCGV